MKILKEREVQTPKRSNPRDAGIDFFIPSHQEKIILNPGESALIPSGIKANILENHALIAFNKSGIASKKKLIVGAEVVDEDYQGEIHFDIHNIGNTPQEILPDQKIVQFLLIPVSYEPIEIANNIDELYSGKTTNRGSGGFGSTGLY